MFEIGINEVSDKRITHEWEGTETILARLFSLANVFDAEIEFITELNSDYSLGGIVLNVYKKHDTNVQGMGTDRRSEIIRYGINIRGISKISDITELYTAIRPTGTDGLTLAGIDKKEYDSNGNLEYYSPSGTIEILAPQARDRFPSTLTTSENDRYIAKVWSYETSNVNTLYGQALAQLKKNCIPQVSYDVDGFIDANIGDTFTIEDKEYKPTLYLEARITEQIISFTDQTTCKTTFDNFVERQSQIDESLIKQMNDLIEANKSYSANIISSNGIIFKKDDEKTILEALVSDGINDITEKFTIKWYKDSFFLIDSKTTEVSATDLENDRSVFRFEALTDNDVIKASAEVTVLKLVDGKSAIVLKIDSVNGFSFKNTGVNTTMTVQIFVDDKIIDTSQKMYDVFGEQAKIIWEIKNIGETEYTPINQNDKRLSDNGFIFALNDKDINNKATFRCFLDF